jgi:7-cyano-7-deazaguanine synthase
MKVVVVYSGGMDSSVLLYQMVAEGHEVYALSVNYGQRHRRELDAAATIAAGLSVTHRTVDLSGLQALWSGSALTNTAIAVPAGYYTEESMKATVVPNRNMVLLSVAASWALSLQADAVAYAAHAGDHTIYPDCREEFVSALSSALLLADWHQVTLMRPFIEKSKGDICRLGASLRVPFEKSWSCYRGGEIHCGTCGTCVERQEAFLHAGVLDPTAYEARYKF